MSTDFLKCINTEENKILIQKGKNLKIVVLVRIFPSVRCHMDFYDTDFLQNKTDV